jgi:hypothetical protein
MKITVELDNNDILREAFEESRMKTLKALRDGFVKKSDYAIDLNLTGCFVYEVEKNKGSTTYSILPDVTDFKVNGETWQQGMRLRI